MLSVTLTQFEQDFCAFAKCRFDALRVSAGTLHQAKVLGNEPFRSIVAYNTGERTFTVVNESAGR